MRYPEDFFEVQTDVYRTYHMTDTTLLQQGRRLGSNAGRTQKKDITKLRDNEAMG